MAKPSKFERLYNITLFFSSLLHVVSAQLFELRSCYSWDGSSSDNIPCNPEANVSACCGLGSKCMTNIYCENPSGFQVVGTCSERSWRSPACPWRLNADRLLMEDRTFSYQANTTACSDGTLCPKTLPSTAENTTCCDTHEGKEEINFHNLGRIPQDYNDLPYYYSKGGYTIPGYTLTSSSSSSSSVASSSATSTASAVGQSFVTPSLSPSPTPDPMPASPRLSNGAKAGIGVGVALGAAILAALIAVLFLLRRRNRGKKSDQTRDTGSAPLHYPDTFIDEGEAPKQEMISEVEAMRPELAGQDPSYRRGELPTNTLRAEMDGLHNFRG